MHRPRLIITTPRPTKQQIIEWTGITPEEIREVDRTLKPLLAKWPTFAEMAQRKEERARRKQLAKK